MSRRWARGLLVGLAVVLAGCSGSSYDGEGQGPDPTAPAGSTTSVTSARTDIVEFEGSIEDVLAGIPEAARFAGGIADWLADVPGQEGVLRNRRGVTLFVPVDDGFSAADRDAAFADPDMAAATIGEHLVVGVVDELTGTITMASGATYELGDGQTIDGRRILRSQDATNGVIHLIDGPLASG